MKNLIMGAIAVAALGAAIWLMLGRGEANNEDAAEGLDQMQYWVCNACRADVVMTKREFMDAAGSGNLRCGQCGGQELQDAYPCHLCGRAVATIGHGALPNTCPHCNGTLGTHRTGTAPPGEGGAPIPPPG